MSRVALDVFRFRVDVEETLGASSHLLAAQGFDRMLLPRPLADLLGLRSHSEFSEPGLICLHRSQRRIIRALGANPEVHITTCRASVRINRRGVYTVLHVRNQPPAFGDETELDRLIA